MARIQKHLLLVVLGIAVLVPLVVGQQTAPAGQAPAGGQRGGGAGRGGNAGAAPAGQGGQRQGQGRGDDDGAAPAQAGRGAAAAPQAGVTINGEVPNYVRVTDAMLQKPPDADWLM